MMSKPVSLARTIDAAIEKNLIVSDSRFARVPVRKVAQAVLIRSGASQDEFPFILRLVGERSIHQGHTLDFS
ncbi:MAG TPA: hypothetical protein VIL88_02795 [Devosia sp.]|jgi:hypothetical protein|uniref:hypothetical protein n=1 Tax=Devosia sp. TaxID=1871048 RepID=UPI002F92476C